jgi:peptidylprolyl isomerase
MNIPSALRHPLVSIAAVTVFTVGLPLAASDAPPPGTMAAVLAASTAEDWRPLDPEKTLYVDLDAGRVIFELAPNFAPAHIANLRSLTLSGWFDGLSINRVQDNFVTQWGDPESSKPLGSSKAKLAPEFEQTWNRTWRMTRLPDGDVYAPQVGFIEGFPAAMDERAGKVWLTHCYGTLGVGRDTAADSGNAAELYAVIGHAPRQLDRNITVIGRAIRGMELLSALPRGTMPLGFYAKAEERIPIRRIRFAADLPPAERTPIEVLRTDTSTFTALIESRRNRRDEWYLQPAGKIDLCSVPIPVRERR